MKRLVVGAAAASLALGTAVVPGAVAKKAPKKPSPRAHTYRGALLPVPVGDYGMLAVSRGKVQMVDGKKNNKISIHLRKVQAGETYAWHLHKAADGVTDPCALPVQDAPSVAGWTYKPLKGGPGGTANASGRSKTFSADPDATYYVDVHLSTGEPFLCGVVKTKAKKSKKAAPAKKSKKAAPGKTPAPGKGKHS